MPAQRRFASPSPVCLYGGGVACTARRFACIRGAVCLSGARFASPEAVCQSRGLCHCEGQLPQVVGVAGFSAEHSCLELCFITGYMIYSTLHLEARRWTTHRQNSADPVSTCCTRNTACCRRVWYFGEGNASTARCCLVSPQTLAALELTLNAPMASLDAAQNGTRAPLARYGRAKCS